MRYYSEDLQRLQQEILEKKRTKAKLSDLQIQQAELKERTAKLEKLMVKEQKDVDRLNRGSLSAFFYRASGQMEEKLSKEEAEAYAARVKYETARSELWAVDEDIAACLREIEGLPECEERYQSLLKSRAEQLMRMEKRLSFLKSQNQEIEEALTAGEQALQATEEILEHLEGAKSWGTIDMLGGGIISDVVKYDHLDQVQEQATTLQNSLRSFRTELADVTDKISGNIQAEIGEFLHFADYFFDSLFTDWMVYNKIAESQNKTLHTKKQIQDILDRL